MRITKEKSANVFHNDKITLNAEHFTRVNPLCAVSARFAVTNEGNHAKSNSKRTTSIAVTFLLSVLLGLFTFVDAQATIRYVKEGGMATAANATSWEYACGNLQDVIDESNAGDIIFVAEGTYIPTEKIQNGTKDRDKTFLLKEGVKIYGGFSENLTGSPTTLPAFGMTGRNGISILSGDIGQTDNVYHVVTGIGLLTEATVLDGFTITGGQADAPADETGKLYVNNVEIFRYGGGGISLYNSASPALSNLVITGNMARDGGGICASSSSPALTNVKITGNKAIKDINDADNGYGGGMYIYNGSSSTLTNVLISGNTTDNDGGGLYIRVLGTPRLINVTVAGNYAGNEYGGVHFMDENTTQVFNSIIYGNTSYGNNYPNVSSFDAIYSYSLVGGATTLNNTDIISSADPKFVNADFATAANSPKFDGDYRLKPGSPAIDKGYSNYNATATDLDGNPRIDGQYIDLGAFESISLAAVNDTALTTVDKPISIKVLANDNRGSCSAIEFGIIAGNGPKFGTVEYNTVVDTLVYTPNSGHFGIDSLDYKFGCNGDFDSARVYILTIKPLSEPYYACPGASVTMGFENILHVTYNWIGEFGNKIKFVSDTIKRVKNSLATELFYAIPVWKNIEFAYYPVQLNLAKDVKPTTTDIRVTLCPTSIKELHLTSFLDSLGYASAVQWTTTGVFPAIHDEQTGEIHPPDFPAHGTFTYSYTRFSECGTLSAAGKAYVHIPNGKIPRRPDTVAVCRKHAEAININSVFGLELGGNLQYDASVNPDNTVSANTVKVSTPSQHAGAVIFNGEKAYQQATNPSYDVKYRGVDGKGFVFEYDYSSGACIKGKKRTVIVITEQ
ncbi:MAG: right-handed parallel beta-helix repeat-containing protein [Prevotellaceae bacterium]|jgi:hypothetical protein|nr:right-handed parallel beta-helix repeat-containing protein [Prevotellaceae bacterium]